MQFDWETQRYHQPSDDMNQPFDFNATVKCTRVDLAVGYEVAQQTERPHWNAGDFFGKFTKKCKRRDVDRLAGARAQPLLSR